MEKMKKYFGSNNEPNNYIVGIGASAGGLEALQKLLATLSPNIGFPYIIVQHLSPDYKSLLGEILGKFTAMPVVQVTDGMEIQPNTVYVISPGKNMVISDNKLLLTSQKEHELNLPIDMFFKSLAEEAGPRAISIVLSGTGSDGSNGIKSIKENDGMIIVQDPESAKFDGMPRSAMRTGLVDAVLSPEEISVELKHISVSAQKRMIESKTAKEIDEDLMKKIYFILKKISNVNFTRYKQTTILRRIERRMMLTHKESLTDYVEYLYDCPDEVKILSKEVLIGVTNFFRDPDFFQTLKEKVVQNILAKSTIDEPVRIWVAGCSTGEEAYSIAILFSEVMESMKIRRIVKIFATDLDVEAVTTAGKGVYGDNIIDSVSSARLSKYFVRKNNTYEINREIRKMIVFSPHNVFQDPPFGRLDLISCRNMLIYFQPVLQNDLFAIFHSSLKDGGYLFLGKSEAIGVFTEAYPVVDAAAKIFTHKSDVKIAGAKAIPYLQSALADDAMFDEGFAGYNRSVVPGEVGNSEQNMIDNTLLEKFMPACLIVDEKNEVIHTYGENSNYVHFSIGKVSNSLYDVITEALKIPVSTLLKEAREKHSPVQYKQIAFAGERENSVINLMALPISRKVSSADCYYAVIFSENKDSIEVPNAIPYEIDRIASQRITDLEQELNDVQDKLNRSVTEQECVNEELQAANEELLTANEELQSSNEELQSVNEELYTVNSEYQLKLTELADMNDDIANFLSSTLIGIIFVDNKLSIRRYTDYVASEFSVMDHDIGRSLKFISYHFPTVDISEICDNVLKTLVPDEREITTGKNKIFFMRVAPYRTTENKILGCVITLVDVTTQKQGLAKLRSAEEQLSLAQQDSEAKSDFLSRIAHEIRTPMQALTGLSENAIKINDSKEPLASTLTKMMETINFMNAIVSDILEVSKSDHSKNVDTKEPFALHDVIDEVVAIISPRMEESKITFELSISDGFTPYFVGSKSRLQQILMNFLTNAVKYSRSGGIVKVRAYEESVVDGKATVCFIVSDNGVGMTSDTVERLFKSDNEDHGDINLTIAHNLVRSMSGSVEVKSELEKGTQFTIKVVLDKYAKGVNGGKPSKTIVGLHNYDLNGCHALVVDDNELNRRILGALIEHEGITYDEASDGEEAAKLFIDKPPRTYDFILMDIRMPHVDGIQATIMIRDSGKEDAKKIPIIGVSANGFADDIKKAHRAGIDVYATKPIDKDKLFESINSLVIRNK